MTRLDRILILVTLTAWCVWLAYALYVLIWKTL